MDSENQENLRKSCKEPRIVKKSHKRSASQDMKSRPNALQVNGHHHHHHHHASLATQALKPRITKLENLEARMASIEVSLSNALENSGARLLTRSCKTTTNGTNNEDHPKTQTQPLGTPVENTDTQNANNINRPMADVLTTMVITNQQQKHITRHQNQNLIRLTDQQQSKYTGHVSDDCIRQNQNQIENKSALIKTLKLKLETLEVNDLDSRIYQAELECLLEKEEMNILNLHQEQISLKAAFNQIALNNNGTNQTQQQLSSPGGAVTMYSVVSGGHCTSVSTMEVPYDTQSPCFYVTAHHCGKGLIVQWAKDTSKLKKGDRLLEVNGQLAISWMKEDFGEVLRQAVMAPLKMVVLRNTPMLPVRKVNSKEVENLKEEMSSVVNKLDTKIKENKELLLSVQKLQKELDSLKDENQKLCHRTFYLEDQVAEASRLTSYSSQLVKKADTNSVTVQEVIRQPVSNACTSLPPMATPKQTAVSALTARGATTLHFGTSANHHKVSTGIFQQTTIKSHSVNQLDKLIVQQPNPNDHHILQVKIPFSPSDQNIGRTVSTYDVRTANTYINVPLPKTLSLQAPLTSSLTLNPSPTRWFQGRQHGADSDSGNYSGDSMDDTQVTASPLMTGFVLQRQRQISQETSSPSRTAVKRVQVATSAVPAHLNHCYVNVVEAKRPCGQNTIQVATEGGQHKQFDCSKGSHIASVQESTAMVRYVNQCQPQREVVKAGDGQRNLSNVKLKVNGNKIGLNDHESDNEEWC